MKITSTVQPNLVLASNSPRRKELLSQLGFQFCTCGSDIDESVKLEEPPETYVKRMAVEKAIAQKFPEDTIVIGSDTCVVYQNHILGKPVNLADSMKMLSMLSGKTHQVLTSIAVTQNGHVTVEVVTSNVTFKPLSEQEIVNYWNTGEPKDKAGSYGIQGIGGQFVSHLEGSYSAVVGLPLYQIAQLLAKFDCFSQVMQHQET